MVMRLVLDQLPEATLISVGHRVELEQFHTRRLVLEYRKDGARLVKDEQLDGSFRRSVRWLSRVRPRAAALSRRVAIVHALVRPYRISRH
jgi:putative ATP-binding cassette transporter